MTSTVACQDCAMKFVLDTTRPAVITTINDSIQFVTNCVVLQVVSLLGIVGNTLNIIVLTRDGRRNSTSLMLLSLSVVDFVNALTTPMRRSSCYLASFDPALAAIFEAYDRVYLSTPNKITSILAASHVALISLERAVAVYLPFHVKRIFSVGRTKLFLAFIYAFWMLINGPFYFAYTLTWSFNPTYNRLMPQAVVSHFQRGNKEILDVLKTLVISILRGPILISIILLCSVFIALRLYVQCVVRSQMSMDNKSGVNMRVVRMLLVVSLVFLSVGIPICVIYLYFYLWPQATMDGSSYSFIYVYLAGDISDLLYTTHASANFIIYLSMSKKFSNTLQGVLNCREGRRFN